MDTRLHIPRKVPKRVQKHTRLSSFFNGDSTISNWFFGSTETVRGSPCVGRRYSSTDRHDFLSPRGRGSIRCASERCASPASEHKSHGPARIFWSDIERRVALPFPWMRGRFAATRNAPSPSPSASGTRWAWIRPRRANAKPASRTCFPSISDDRIHNNILGCLFSGILLMIILTVCT